MDIFEPEMIEAVRQMEARLQASEADLSRLQTELTAATTALEQKKARVVSLERELQRERESLLAQIDTVERERGEIQATLHAVVHSRAWRLAEKVRVPWRKMQRDWPRLSTIARFVGRKFMGSPGTQVAEKAAAKSPQQGQAPERAYSAAAYVRWMDEQEPSPEELLSQRKLADSLTDRPLFSIIVPVYRTPQHMLQECLQSVLEQTYARWELCIAYAGGEDSRNLELVRDLASRDSRVRVLELEENRGISGNSNAALDLATGDFVALLDHDDTLAPFALFEVAARLRAEPGAEILYSDHDYLDPVNGLRSNPLFKPDWSPELMLSANYITHFTVLRRSLLEQIGRFDPATDGAQDWDLFLRATERTSHISHIAKILYHWRMHAESTAHNGLGKNYAAAQLLALSKHLERCGIDAEPEVMPNGLLHARFRRKPEKLVSIIIPTRDRVDLLSRCVSSLLEHTQHEDFEILIIDNDSGERATKKYFHSLEGDKRFRIISHQGAFNYSVANNRAAREAKGDFLLFLNNDVEIIRPDWLNELACWAGQKNIGIVGARLLYGNGTIQHAGVVLGMSGFADHPFAQEAALTFGLAGSTGWYRNFLAITGACMMIRREIFDSLGGFDESFTLCGSDVELCLRARERGFRIVYNPFAELIHHEQQTRGGEVPAGDYLQSFKRYRRWLAEGDPYWNPNLSLWSRRPIFRYRAEPSSLEFAKRHVERLKANGSPVKSNRVSEEDLMVRWFDCSDEQFRRLRKQAAAVQGFRRVKRVLWLIPAFENPFYGGIFTILRFAEYWKREKQVESLFAICGATDHQVMADRIRTVYPDLADSHLSILESVERAADLPAVDASICTLWTTAYFALHHEGAARRFYLIQDFEPSFYRAGSISALVDSTYRMGLYGIANTVSLKTMYESEYGGKAMHFTPCINEAVFCTSEIRRARNPIGPWQVFCYGRPNHPRNAFELLKSVAHLLKERMGDQVRIVSAGGDWDPSEHGLTGIVENLGVLAYEDTARLYRQSDVGVVMMLTRHPSYIPLELMASGCLTVSNANSWTAWLLKDNENCLLAFPTATAIADAIEHGLRDSELRERITDNALKMVRSRYLDWPTQMENVYEYLCDPQAYIDAWLEVGRGSMVSTRVASAD
ncbi:MAG: glycosyltransferase [Bryobacteraceae bacterium]